MEYFSIDGLNFHNMVVNGYNKLQQQKDLINSLNVFPVPDGDTGTNMSMTFKAAISEIEGINSKSISEVSKIIAKGALMGARGNSGVILSQIFRGIAKGLEGHESVDVKVFANSLVEGSKAAYKAVMKPTEGTILTIIRTAGEFAAEKENTDITKMMEGVYNNSELILSKTPEMLPVLKKAKVVDSGGMGLVVILKGMFEALRDDIKADILEMSESDLKTNVKLSKAEIAEEEIKFGYCTEFIILNANTDTEVLKKELIQHGDSIAVVGLDDIIKVHIHTNDPGLVLSKAVKIGELSKIKIDNMREEHREVLLSIKDEGPPEVIKQPEEEVKKYGFIAVAAGDGIKNIFSDLGADVIVEGGQTMNPSTQDILSGINKINAENIFIFPNNKNIIMASTQAAGLTNKNITVIPTKTIPQGITCITAFNPEADREKNKEVMINSISTVSSASVTFAVRDTEIDGFDIKEGNILGLIEGKISEVGKDIFEVCDNLISKMIKAESELITIYYGKDCVEEDVMKFVNSLKGKYQNYDIQCYYGQQPLYYFIVSVE